MPHLTASQLEALRRYDTPTLANAIETFDVRLRNEGFTRGAGRCFSARPKPMLGYAVTLRMKSSNPPAEAHAYGDRSDWWDAIQAVPAPRIVVIQDVDDVPGDAALFGFTHVNIWKALGCIGAMTDGAVRDLPAIQNLDFHLYGAGLSPSHGYSHIVDVGETVTVTGLEIRHGDLLHGDLNGVITVPEQIADRLPEAAEAIVRRDRQITDLCSSGEFSVEKLRQLLQVHFPSAPQP